MNVPICKQMSLDSTGNFGPASECGQPIALGGGTNAVQLEMIAFSMGATNISCQLQVSNDLENWTNTGTANTMTAVGRKLFSSDAAISAAYLRYEFTITGTGKAIFAATANLSEL